MASKLNHLLSLPRAQWLIAIFVLACLVIALWIPTGLNIAGYGDEWVNLAAVDAGAPWVLGTLRSFLAIPYQIAHILTPDSFAGMNIVLAVTTFGRGLAIYALMRRLLPDNSALALVAGGLAAVYPGDVGYFALVCSSITTAVAFFILALVFLIDYWQRPRRLFVIGMWLSLIFSIGIYEVSYPLIVMVPAILIYLNGRMSKRVIQVTLLWYALPFLYVIMNILNRLLRPNLVAYQLSAIGADNSLAALVNAFVETYVRVFWRVWGWAALTMPQGFSDKRTWLVLGAGVLFVLALWVHQWHTRSLVVSRRHVMVLFGGVVVVALGFALYSITVFRDGYFRTLFYALPGAAVALAVALWLLSRLPTVPRIIIAVALCLLALIFFRQTYRLSAVLVATAALGFVLNPRWSFVLMGTALVTYAAAFTIGFHQEQPFADLPARQASLTKAITEQAPYIKGHTLIVLAESSAQSPQFATVRNRYDILQAMLTFVYKNYDLETQLCVPHHEAWGEYNTSCRFEQDELVVSTANIEHRWPYDQILVFSAGSGQLPQLLDQIPAGWMEQKGTGSSIVYNPEALIDRSAPLPYRLNTVWSASQP